MCSPGLLQWKWITDWLYVLRKCLVQHALHFPAVEDICCTSLKSIMHTYTVTFKCLSHLFSKEVHRFLFRMKPSTKCGLNYWTACTYFILRYNSVAIQNCMVVNSSLMVRRVKTEKTKTNKRGIRKLACHLWTCRVTSWSARGSSLPRADGALHTFAAAAVSPQAFPILLTHLYAMKTQGKYIHTNN